MVTLQYTFKYIGSWNISIILKDIPNMKQKTAKVYYERQREQKKYMYDKHKIQ